MCCGTLLEGKRKRCIHGITKGGRQADRRDDARDEAMRIGLQARRLWLGLLSWSGTDRQHFGVVTPWGPISYFSSSGLFGNSANNYLVPPNANRQGDSTLIPWAWAMSFQIGPEVLKNHGNYKTKEHVYVCLMPEMNMGDFGRSLVARKCCCRPQETFHAAQALTQAGHYLHLFRHWKPQIQKQMLEFTTLLKIWRQPLSRTMTRKPHVFL